MAEPTEHLVGILESISDGFISMDNQLVVNYFNRAAEKLLGRGKKDVLNKYFFDAFPEARGSIFEEKYTDDIVVRLMIGGFGVMLLVSAYKIMGD